MKYLHYSIVIYVTVFFFYSCGKENPVTPPPGENYFKVVTGEKGNIRFEIWSTTADSLQTGYNKIGFKVYENGQAKKTGFVKYFMKMYHFGGSNIHGTPVEPQYYYNTSLDLFSGYIIMLMPSDSTSKWYGFFNFNDEIGVDSINIGVKFNSKTKFQIFVDLSTQLSYLITVLDPLDAQRNINTFRCILHESFDFIDFTQINNAQMYIKPWINSLNHGSTNNTNPVDNGSGIYEGKVNFDYSGLWNVYDSIYYNNKWITPSGAPPSITFDVP